MEGTANNTTDMGVIKGKVAEYAYQFLPIVLMIGIQILSSKNYGIHDYVKSLLLITVVDSSAVLAVFEKRRQSYSRIYPLLLGISCLAYGLAEAGTMNGFGKVRSIIADIFMLGIFLVSLFVKVRTLGKVE